MYLAWALFAEGQTDVRYLETLIPRLILDLVPRTHGPEAIVPDNPVDVFGVTNRSFDQEADRICKAIEAFQLLFVHGDTGTPAQEQHLADRTCALCERVKNSCGLKRDRCVVIAPRRETEAWCLVDKTALRSAFGVWTGFDLSFVPDTGTGIESISDPKAVLKQIQDSIAGSRRRRSPPVPYSGLGQMQGLERLRTLPSFGAFEKELVAALKTLGYPNLA